MDIILTMTNIIKTECSYCKGTGEVDDPLWGKKRCPVWNCKGGFITKEEKTVEELDAEFKAEQEKLNAECKL
jgi:DnaJ-class molecular chaperone